MLRNLCISFKLMNILPDCIRNFCEFRVACNITLCVHFPFSISIPLPFIFTTGNPITTLWVTCFFKQLIKIILGHLLLPPTGLLPTWMISRISILSAVKVEGSCLNGQTHVIPRTSVICFGILLSMLPLGTRCVEEVGHVEVTVIPQISIACYSLINLVRLVLPFLSGLLIINFAFASFSTGINLFHMLKMPQYFLYIWSSTFVALPLWMSLLLKFYLSRHATTVKQSNEFLIIYRYLFNNLIETTFKTIYIYLH